MACLVGGYPPTPEAEVTYPFGAHVHAAIPTHMDCVTAV